MSTKTITISLLGKLTTVGSDTWNHAISLVDRAAAVCKQHNKRGLVIGTMEEDCEPNGYWKNLLIFQEHVRKQGLDFCLFLNAGTIFWRNPTPGVVVKYVDFMLLKTWKYHLTADRGIPTVWNNKGKILFLTGKPDRIHRAPVIWKLYKEKQLDNFDWSLFVPPALEKSVREIMPPLTESEWQDFLTLQRSPDGIKPIVNGNSLHYYGFPIGEKVYTSTSVSLVSESMFKESYAIPRATEKLWKSITYQHPFVVLGSPGLLSSLKIMGYRTFEEYLPFPDYNDEKDPDLAIEMACQNVIMLQQIAIEHPNHLIPDVVHNYQLNKARFFRAVANISKTLAKFGYQGQVFDAIPTHDAITADAVITNKYEVISL